MKKNIGSVLSLYPTPVVVVGTMVDDKPTWTLVAHVGILGHDRILISLASAHYINEFIKKNGNASVNIVSEKMLPSADYVGSVSAKNVDKSEAFDYELSEKGCPLIKSSPLSIECMLTDDYKTKGFDNFIFSIDSTYVDESCLKDGKIDYRTLKPVLFEFPTYEYIKSGDVLGKCLSFKDKRN